MPALGAKTPVGSCGEIRAHTHNPRTIPSMKHKHKTTRTSELLLFGALPVPVQEVTMAAATVLPPVKIDPLQASKRPGTLWLQPVPVFLRTATEDELLNGRAIARRCTTLVHPDTQLQTWVVPVEALERPEHEQVLRFRYTDIETAIWAQDLRTWREVIRHLRGDPHLVSVLRRAVFGREDEGRLSHREERELLHGLVTLSSLQKIKAGERRQKVPASPTKSAPAPAAGQPSAGHAEQPPVDAATRETPPSDPAIDTISEDPMAEQALVDGGGNAADRPTPEQWARAAEHWDVSNARAKSRLPSLQAICEALDGVKYPSGQYLADRIALYLTDPAHADEAKLAKAAELIRARLAQCAPDRLDEHG